MAANKRAGKKSLAQNDFLEPATPINISATDVGTDRPFNDGAAMVSFELPANSPAATSYTVTSTPGGFSASKASGPIEVTGLQSATSYTFKVTAANAAGVSGESLASGSVSITTVPATPSAPTATSPSGANYDTVSWTAPANGGKAISLYRYTSSDGKTGTTTSTSINVTQEQGTAQTYQVRAENANGNGSYSASSSSVTTFSFVPFSVFGFFGFGPFGFSPFGFAPYFNS
jgi:hypothetical protein